VRALLAHRVLLAAMAVVIGTAAAYLAGEPRAGQAQKRRHPPRE
jgi:hypothetical protein